ncbi:hypothetical protein CN674_22175 [Bacillus toyonensis]|nr:hypothetical protein CN674_22175 [Bacillus toyonensis]
MISKLELSNYFFNKGWLELAYFCKLLEDYHSKKNARANLLFILLYYIESGNFPSYYVYQIVLGLQDMDPQPIEDAFNNYGALWIFSHIKKQN